MISSISRPSFVTPPARPAAAPPLARPVDVVSPFSIAPARTEAPAPLGPSIDAAAMAPTRGVGSFVLGALVAVAVLGAVGAGVIGSGGPPPPPDGQISVPSSMTPQQAQNEYDALRYLQNVGSRNGGGISRQYLGVVDQPITAQKGLDMLAHGDEIIYRESKNATPQHVHNFPELDRLRNDVREQQIKNAIEQGLSGIQDGLSNLGNVIHDGLPQTR
jgi:hypothetical protein